MLLYAVRHGIAIEREAPGCPPESGRFLTDEGRRKTNEVAEGLASLGVEADLFLSSPYVRALQTAEIFAAALRYPKQKILPSELLLPGADGNSFYRELAKHRRYESIFCFGHAPHLDDLIAAGLGLKHPITELKKAGVALLELSRLSPPSSTLLWLLTPKILKHAGK